MTNPPFMDQMWCARWREAVDHDPELAHIGRWCTLDLVLLAEGHGTRLRIDAGRITEVEPWQDNHPDAVVLDAPPRDWMDFFRSVPPRWHYDVLGMERRVPDFRIMRGRDTLIRHLRALHRVFELARKDSADA